MSQYTADGAEPVDDAAVDDPPTVDDVLEEQAERDDLPDPNPDPDHIQVPDDAADDAPDEPERQQRDRPLPVVDAHAHRIASSDDGPR